MEGCGCDKLGRRRDDRTAEYEDGDELGHTFGSGNVHHLTTPIITSYLKHRKSFGRSI